ncbi:MULTISPECIES: hypothetical protein [unclassified Rhizobium]|nr:MULTISPECIES: hypothetical protein [unclassified Rhizobium]
MTMIDWCEALADHLILAISPASSGMVISWQSYGSPTPALRRDS